MKSLGKLGLVLMLLFAALRWPTPAKAAPPYSNYWCGAAFAQQQSSCEQTMYTCTEYCPRNNPTFVFCVGLLEPDVTTGEYIQVTQCYNGPNDTSCMKGCTDNINGCIINAIQSYCTPAP